MPCKFECKDKILELRELVYMQDIPHPITPEYRELHEKDPEDT